jgi:hypothetical protein
MMKKLAERGVLTVDRQRQPFVYTPARRAGSRVIGPLLGGCPGLRFLVTYNKGGGGTARTCEIGAAAV